MPEPRMESAGKCPTIARGGWALLELTDALSPRARFPFSLSLSSAQLATQTTSTIKDHISSSETRSLSRNFTRPRLTARGSLRVIKIIYEGQPRSQGFSPVNWKGRKREESWEQGCYGRVLRERERW